MKCLNTACALSWRTTALLSRLSTYLTLFCHLTTDLASLECNRILSASCPHWTLANPTSSQSMQWTATLCLLIVYETVHFQNETQCLFSAAEHNPCSGGRGPTATAAILQYPECRAGHGKRTCAALWHQTEGLFKAHNMHITLSFCILWWKKTVMKSRPLFFCYDRFLFEIANSTFQNVFN